MPKTIQQILDLEQQHIDRSRKGVEIASSNGNADLLALNVGQAFKGHLMQGLIRWRHGVSEPASTFREGLAFLRREYSTWQSMSGGNSSGSIHLPIEKANFLAALVNDPLLPCGGEQVAVDRSLDVLLARDLQDLSTDGHWDNQLKRLGQIKGAALASESYAAYHALLRASASTDVEKFVAKAVSQFDRRKGDRYYRGGEATDGGGDNNSLTVDYRLAAIMKRIGYRELTIHSWR